MNPNTLINAARLAEKAGQTGLATALYTRSAKGTSDQRAEALYRLANLELKEGDPADVQKMLEEAIELQPNRAPWHYRLATILEQQGNKADALPHYAAASGLEPSNEVWRQRLERCENAVRIAKAKAADERAKLLRRKGARWQELEVLLGATPSFGKSPDWFLRLGESLEAMNRFPEAAEAFHEANTLRPARPVNLAREGYCWQVSGFHDRAQDAYEAAQASDREYGSRELGVGVFFERRGMWHEAASKFELEAEKRPMAPEIHFRAGKALERTYSWKTAAARYREATLLNPAEARYHFRLGFTHERSMDFAAAEECYAYGLSLPSKTPPAKYWYYRLGVVRESQGKLESATEAYSASLDVPATGNIIPDSDPAGSVGRSHYELELLENAKLLALRSLDTKHILALAGEFEQRSMWEDAIDCLEAAVDRTQSFTASIYFRLGLAHKHLEQYEEASRAFRMTRISVPPRGIDAARYKKDKTLQEYFEYAEMSESLPLRDNVIFYESFFGKQITCNPYALFREVFGDPKYSTFMHVWSVTPETCVPAWMKNLENVVFVKRGTHLYRRYLATAKYLVNNVTFQSFFVRREGQKYLNTWHGTPMKTLGKDIGTGVLEHRNVSRNFLHATHLVTPNDHTTQVLLDRYDVQTLSPAKVGYTGYPRIDLTLEDGGMDRASVLKELGIEPTEQRKIVLYAPTWRGGASYQHFDTERLVSDLEALSELDCIVLFQGHHLSVSLIPDHLPVRVVNEAINTNELLAVTDILVTDYSSIMYDFFPTGRPVICYTYDLEDYAAERGLYFTPEDLGLCQVTSGASLISAVEEALHRPEAYRASEDLVSRFCGREDGQASSRVKSFFLEDDDKFVLPKSEDDKQRILFHHSMLPNGISSSLTNLLWSLDPEVYDLTVIVPVGVIEKSDGGIGVLNGLPSYVKVLADGGRQVVNIEEKWLIDYFNKWNFLPSEHQRELYLAAFKREYRRLLGEASFDVIVEFEGYSRYWTSVLAAGSDTATKIMYLHNDMESERLVRFPYLQSVFNLYSHFDVLASVSPVLSELNKEGVGQTMVGELDKFVPVVNQIDPERVRRLAAEPLDDDLVPWFSNSWPTLLTMGRLSTEKDQAKLLRALAVVSAEGYQAKLVLLGDGPMRQDLEQLAKDLNLDQMVYFAGLRENPFPALAAAECFVLPSNHEGQPMVLLESMILEKQIVATDIPGSRYVLSENPQCVVENSVQGLAAGLRRVLDGDSERRPVFEVERYQTVAMNAFLDLVRG